MSPRMGAAAAAAPFLLLALLVLLGSPRHAAAATAATAAAAVEAGQRTRYVVHYMPWFTGTGSGHWCNPQWGNAWYESVFGEYDVSDPAVYRRQLQLMRAAGIDGLWFDFQSPAWIPRIQVIAEEAARIGLNFAVVADNYGDEHIVNSMQEALRAWMQMPNYYRVDGRPVLPIFETPHRWAGRKAVLPAWEVDGQRPFVIGTYHWYQNEGEPLPAGIDSLYFWHSPDLAWLERVYYRSSRFAVKVGSIFRGWREAYTDWHHSPPYLGFLNRTLQLAGEYEPAFAQVVTWNDYSEGTMLEPSFLRAPGGCVDPTLSYWNSESWACPGFDVGRPCTPGSSWGASSAGSDEGPCSGSGEEPCARVEDCSKPAGTAEGAAAEACRGAAAAGEEDEEPIRSAYSDLAAVAEAILGTPPAEAIALFKAIVASVPSTTTTTPLVTFEASLGLEFEPPSSSSGGGIDDDGTDDTACRGEGAHDDSSSYYALHSVRSLAECQALCVASSAACTGVEYWFAHGRCEVWSRHIGVKVAREGFTCIRVQNASTSTTVTVTATMPEVTTAASSATSTASAATSATSTPSLGTPAPTPSSSEEAPSPVAAAPAVATPAPPTPAAPAAATTGSGAAGGGGAAAAAGSGEEEASSAAASGQDAEDDDGGGGSVALSQANGLLSAPAASLLLLIAAAAAASGEGC